MAQQNQQPTSDQAVITKGKSPRNALIGVGLIAALVIGGIGFYYQLKESNEAAAEAALTKKTKMAASVDRKVANSSTDVDKIIEDQQKAARKAAAEAARAASAAEVHPKPALTMNGFVDEQKSTHLAAEADHDNIMVAPIFKSGTTRIQTQQQGVGQSPSLPGSLPTPQEMLARQQAAQDGSQASAAQIAAAAARAGVPASPSTSGQRDTLFLKDQATGEGFLSAGFVGQSHGCTLSPPHHIPVLTIEGLNSDRPGKAALLVDEDVYDSITGTCLMIPKGSTIVAPYSSDIQVGQESILVAATELRLPNGKHVPLTGAQGADADGTAGFSGDVNNHFLKIFGASFITAILLRRFDGGDSTQTVGPLGVSQVGSTAGQVAAQTSQSILNRYQNIPPTITDKIGQRFMVQVNRDITLEPYHE